MGNGNFTKLSPPHGVIISSESNAGRVHYPLQEPEGTKMYVLSSQEFWAHFFFEFRCRNCGGDVGYVSRPRNFFERRIVPLFLMKMVRCGDCYHRSFRPVNVKVRPRREPMTFDP